MTAEPDQLLTRWRSNALDRNTGRGRFEGETASVGRDGDRDFPTSAAFADFDGALYLYVAHHLVWDTDHPALSLQELGKISCSRAGANF